MGFFFSVLFVCLFCLFAFSGDLFLFVCFVCLLLVEILLLLLFYSGD